jgi:hypothetical protein
VRTLRIFGPERKEVTRESCVMKSVMICTKRHVLYGDEIKDDEMGGACGMHGGEAKCV